MNKIIKFIALTLLIITGKTQTRFLQNSSSQLAKKYAKSMFALTYINGIPVHKLTSRPYDQEVKNHDSFLKITYNNDESITQFCPDGSKIIRYPDGSKEYKPPPTDDDDIDNR